MISGFHTNRFHIFSFLIFDQFARFLVSSYYQIIDSSHITLLAFGKTKIEQNKILKDVDYGFNGLHSFEEFNWTF